MGVALGKSSNFFPDANAYLQITCQEVTQLWMWKGFVKRGADEGVVFTGINGGALQKCFLSFVGFV